MTDIIHQDLAKDRWFKMSLSDQLANVGSEFSRAFRAKERQKEARFQPAFFRMLELLNLTLKDPRWTGHRRREIARLKEVIVSHIYGETTNLPAIASLERYFYYFGISRQK